MRRKDREITSKEELEDILKKADVCRIAFNSDSFPYIVPLNFGFTWNEKIELFFHCAAEGRKLDLLSHDNRVCFEVDIEHELVKGEKSCAWGMKYKSIIGTGTLNEVKDDSERKAALDQIMIHYGCAQDKIEYDMMVLSKTRILKLDVQEMTGKEK